jgi:hypothetical protein
MEAVFQVVRQASSMVTKTFSAGEKFASALEHVGRFTEESAAAFADEAAHKRQMNIELQRAEFAANLKLRKKELAAKSARLQLPED